MTNVFTFTILNCMPYVLAWPLNEQHNWSCLKNTEQSRLCIAFIQQRKSGGEESTWFLRSWFSSWQKAVLRNALILSDHSTWWYHSWFLTCKLTFISRLFVFSIAAVICSGTHVAHACGMGASSSSFQLLTWLSLILSKEWRGGPAKATLAAGWYSKSYANMLIFKGYAIPCPGN